MILVHGGLLSQFDPRSLRVIWGLHSGYDLIKRDVDIFVFPDSNYLPSRLHQHVAVSPIAIYVSFDLRVPVLRVDRWASTMLRAAMPEAAIDEYGDLLFGEDYVRTHAPAGEIYPQVTSISVTEAVEC